ncbi:MAG: hypothetical protein EZS28_035019, partial [Streblomastix strix]
MEESSFRPDKTVQSVSRTSVDEQTNIPSLIHDLESDNINLHIPALRELLNIIVDNCETKELIQKYQLMPLLNKFAGNVEKNEEYVQSTTILHVIGVRNGSDDKIILAGSATESIILSIFSPDEKTSKSGSKSLGDLIEENEIIRNSLVRTGFIQKVQYAFTNCTTPYHVKCGVLDILLRLITNSDNLEPIAILIPILTELKNNGEKETKKKSINILGILIANGINSTQSDSEKVKDEKIQQLEESNRLKDDELQHERMEKERIQIELRQTNEEKQKEKEKDEKQIETLQAENIQLKTQNKKQKEEIVNLNFKQSSNYPITIINQDPSYFDLTDIDDIMKKISKKKENEYCNVSLTQILENGVWEIEIEFNGNDMIAVGIVRDSFNLKTEVAVNYSPNTNHIATYLSKNTGWGGNKGVYYKYYYAQGNAGYGTNQRIKQQFDSEKGTLIFFVDGVQQPVYVRGINEKVRFVV